jgi:hypothetical protein
MRAPTRKPKRSVRTKLDFGLRPFLYCFFFLAAFF